VHTAPERRYLEFDIPLPQHKRLLPLALLPTLRELGVEFRRRLATYPRTRKRAVRLALVCVVEPASPQSAHSQFRIPVFPSLSDVCVCVCVCVGNLLPPPPAIRLRQPLDEVRTRALPRAEVEKLRHRRGSTVEPVAGVDERLPSFVVL
jgi:hypothetical protein